MQAEKPKFDPAFVELIKRWRAETGPLSDQEWKVCKSFIDQINQIGIQIGEAGAAKDDMEAVQQGLIYSVQAEWALKTRRHPDLMPVEEARRKVEEILETLADPLGACRQVHNSVAHLSVTGQLGAYSQAIAAAVAIGDYDSLPELLPIEIRLSLAKDSGLEYEEVSSSRVSSAASNRLKALAPMAMANTKKGPVAREKHIAAFCQARDSILAFVNEGNPELSPEKVEPLVRQYFRIVWAARTGGEPGDMPEILLDAQASRLAPLACAQPTLFKQGLRADTCMNAKSATKSAGCAVLLAALFLPAFGILGAGLL